MHLVGWNKIIKSKDEGGLGIQAAKAKNIALLAKLNWRMYHEREAFWAKVLLNKYCSQTRRSSRDPDKLLYSPNWIAIKKGFPIFVRGIGWNVGSPSKLMFWSNKWVKGDSVKELIQGPLLYAEDLISIEEMRQGGFGIGMLFPLFYLNASRIESLLHLSNFMGTKMTQ